MTREEYYKGYNIDRIAIEQMLDELNSKRAMIGLIDKEISSIEARIKRRENDVEEARKADNKNEVETKERWISEDNEEKQMWIKIFDIVSEALAEDIATKEIDKRWN